VSDAGVVDILRFAGSTNLTHARDARIAGLIHLTGWQNAAYFPGQAFIKKAFNSGGQGVMLTVDTRRDPYFAISHDSA